jgi:transposase
MRKHPEIEVVSRDRGEEYAAAARLGAPQATQCADRFHLAQNLTKLVEENLARRLGMGERTVRYWLSRGIPYGKPELRHKRRRGFDRHAAYVTEHWNQGERNGLQLWRELQTQGYKGSPRTVYRLLAILRECPAPSRGKAERAQAVPDTPLQDFSAKDTIWLFVRDPSDLEETERQVLAVIRQASPTANMLYELVQEFMTMLRHRKGERLDNWLRSARHSHIRELQRFVRSIERDNAAVLAGLTLPHSNGVVEGKVNKLKLIKRMGFGRAGFPLLRQRVLHAF